MLRVVDDGASREREVHELSLDELAREGARQMLKSALEAEVEEYIQRHRDQRDEHGRRLVVRNGHARERSVTVGSGTIPVAAPRVDDRRVDDDGRKRKFRSKILPPYMRKSPKVSEVLPLLYLRGLSTGDFREALPVLLGEDAAGLSPSAITRLTRTWRTEYDQFCQRDLSDRDFVYVWADGVHFRIRLEDERLCTLVLLGVRPDGRKELIAVEDGYRESKESWSELLRDLKKRGMRAPALAIGDGALGFWAAVRDVWPETQAQRCWVHRIANVLDKLPKRVQPKAKKALHQIMNAETRQAAQEAVEDFASEYGDRFPKALASLTRDRDKLLTFFDFPARHWQHLRTTNAIESSFATVRLRQRVTKGAGSRIKGLTMAYKLLDMAQLRWRRVNAPNMVPLVRAGVQFVDGRQVEQPDPTDPTTQVRQSHQEAA